MRLLSSALVAALALAVIGYTQLKARQHDTQPASAAASAADSKPTADPSVGAAGNAGTSATRMTIVRWIQIPWAVAAKSGRANQTVSKRKWRTMPGSRPK